MTAGTMFGMIDLFLAERFFDNVVWRLVMAQKFYNKASVQVAIVTGIVTIVVTVLYVWNDRSQLKQDNKNYISEISELKQKNQELTSEVQRLETQLTPFKTIALERFTGTEQEALQKLADELNELKDRMDPFKKPIASATANVEVTIESEEQVHTTYMQEGGYLGFVEDRQFLMFLSNTVSYARQTGNGEVIYKADLQIKEQHSKIGDPVEILQESDLIQIYFHKIPNNSHVITGKASVVINGDMRLEFNVPPQQMRNDLILIRNIEEEFLKVRESMK